jgi:AraC-like DNA-binding protein
LDQHWVHFTATLPGGIELFELVEPEYVVKDDAARKGGLFERLEALNGQHHPQAELEKTGILHLLVAAFLGKADGAVIARRRKAYVRFQSTLDYIEGHLGESLRIGELARLAHLERTYFSRIFQQCLGVKPVEYVMRRRVERAKQRLWSTDEPLRAIADGLGFTDAFHFSKCFKRLSGLTPSDFRALRLGRRVKSDLHCLPLPSA